MFFPQPYAVELVHNLGQMTCIYAFKMKREVEKKKRTKGLKKKLNLLSSCIGINRLGVNVTVKGE